MKARQVISIDSDAFTKLLDEAVAHIKRAYSTAGENHWIQAEEAKKILGITSNTSLQKLRDDGRIRFSQPQHKIILYDRLSILEYIEKHAKNTF